MGFVWVHRGVLGGVEHGLGAGLDDLVLGEFEGKDLVEGVFQGGLAFLGLELGVLSRPRGKGALGVVELIKHN